MSRQGSVQKSIRGQLGGAGLTKIFVPFCLCAENLVPFKGAAYYLNTLYIARGWKRGRQSERRSRSREERQQQSETSHAPPLTG